MEISDQDFEKLINESMDELPQEYIRSMKNVAVTYADEPTPEQRHKQQLRADQTLYGLYEGIPLTQRGAGYNLVLPDKITIFKLPMLKASPHMAALKWQVKHTLWHEIAHHFGLGHDRIHEIERNWHQ
ncbi:MAG TPA: metallopeptidase family protein [Candidatus Saccharimonadales bacterium]|nr:metallopeptidase family protein [Candidatus Saccharimonadales bacterium]